MKKFLTYTPAEVADHAGVTRRTVYAWIASGKLPAHKVGPKMWVVYRGVLSAFMAGDDAHVVAATIKGRVLGAGDGTVNAQVVRNAGSEPEPVQVKPQQQKRRVVDTKPPTPIQSRQATLINPLPGALVAPIGSYFETAEPLRPGQQNKKRNKGRRK